MSGTKVCKKCNKKNLGWDKEFHSKTGKWKLENHKRQDGKWCNKPPEKVKMRLKKDLTLCQLCEGSIGGLCRKEDMQNHMDIWHPNGEVMTTMDYRMQVGGIPKRCIKYYKDDTHYMKHYISVK